jgi:hypothetical protein
VVQQLPLHRNRLRRAPRHNNKFISTKLHRFFSFTFTPTECDNVTAHLGRKLNCQVAEGPDAKDSNPVSGSQAMPHHGRENRYPCTHHRGGVFETHPVWNRIQKVLLPNGVTSETALVTFVCAKLVSVYPAMTAITRYTFFTMATAVVTPAKSDAIATAMFVKNMVRH